MKTHIGHSENLIAEIMTFVEQSAVTAGLSAMATHKLMLVIEELVTNSANHGDLTDEDYVELELDFRDDDIVVHYADTGVAFDPVKNAPPDDRHLEAEDRRVGGLGWPLIRDLSHNLSYERRDDMNNLHFVLSR